MDLFTADDNVASWEKELLSLRGSDRIALLVPLAWHLRQRDHRRALELSSQALSLLSVSTLPGPRAERVRLRIGLVRAETMRLEGQLDAALAEVERLLPLWEALGDACGCADAHWMLAWIAIDRGDHARSNGELARAALRARECGDAERAGIADAATARWAVLHDRNAAVAVWGQRFTPAAAQAASPALATWIYDYLALAAGEAGDFAAAAGYFIRCYECALQTGQLRAAITAANNLGENFAALNDHQSALEWLKRGLDLARPTGLPRDVGGCLMNTADTLRRLGQLEPAREMLDEALAILRPLANGRSYAMALRYLGDMCLDQKDYEGALDAFRRLAERALALGHSDFRSVALRGQAHALLLLGRGALARDAALEAEQLAREQNHVHNQIAALRVLAMIHSRHQLPPPDGMAEPTAALHYLHAALAAGSGIDGFLVPGEMLDAMAAQYAALGDYRRAYEIATQASAARETTHSRDATNRAVAMHVHNQTDRARNEGQHLRQLAEAEARRAEVLQRTSSTLERLSAIGREVTAHLDPAAVFETLNRHIHGLMPATTFAIYLTDPGGTMLVRVFGVEQGAPMAHNSFLMSNPAAISVRCITELREIYIENWGDSPNRYVVPGTVDNMTGLFAPLMAGDRAIGVMTVQALEPYAYGDLERLVFRTLCAYGAIALDNARAYTQLRDAQSQLVAQEKLAALGSLMAGVAHELNTPIGNSLLIASTLQDRTTELAKQVEAGTLRRSDLQRYVDDAGKATVLAMRGLTSAATLVNSFKQVAVDRTTEQRRSFDLRQVCQEIVATMMNRLRAAGHSIEVEVPPGLVLDSYPGPFGQVITNFINNALLHAFDGRRDGRMQLSAQQLPDSRIQVQFSDDGCGIPAENLARIYDPFFTTKLGQGGSGLGLSISYNIVTALLGGQVTVTSGDSGTTFTLELPLAAPESAQPEPEAIY
ncbi:MAG TPA: ATP-binding protein [Telluria sp.]|nr:ATP-binding protein [Telluria sp.]